MQSTCSQFSFWMRRGTDTARLVERVERRGRRCCTPGPSIRSAVLRHHSMRDRRAQSTHAAFALDSETLYASSQLRRETSGVFDISPERIPPITFISRRTVLVLCCLFVFCVRTLEVIGLFSILLLVYDSHRASSSARYNVIGVRRRTLLKVFAMWYKWATLVLVCCALVRGEEVKAEEAKVEETTLVEEATTTEPSPTPLATTRAPPRTLDRLAAELAWKTWLQSPESGNQNAPPRRITTKSLFITPLVCPKGQRLDRNGCVQAITINKDEHERNLLAQLNALFTPAPATGGDLYDYGDDEPGPLQLSIPIGLDPLAAPLQGQDPLAQAQALQENFVKFDKKDKPDGGSSIEAELEILKLQNTNYTSQSQGAYAVDHNDLTNMHLHPDKPKRDSIAVNVTDAESTDKAPEEVGQKEVVYGHVNVDPILYHLNNQDSNSDNVNNEKQTDNSQTQNTAASTITEKIQVTTENKTETSTNATGTASDAPQIFKKDGDQTKLNPENDYSDIGEAIKLISRYAEVTTDDNFAKDQKKNAATDDGILGTRTRLQHRRNKPKGSDAIDVLPSNDQPDYRDKSNHVYPKNGVYYRYPWPSQHAPTPPPDYPFRHLQDYWPGRNKFGGVYNTHENPRRHHHSYPHSLRPHGNPYVSLPNIRDAYPEQLKGYIHRVAQRHLSPVRPRSNNQDLYSLLGLRHWFSSEGTSKR